MSGTELAPRAERHDAVLAPADLNDTIRLGQILAKSGFFKDAAGAAQAITKVLAGRELGFGPVASMTGIYIVKERVTLSANLIAAAVKRSGKYNYRVRRLDAEACAVEFFEHGESVGVSEFTIAEARAAGLATSQTWKSYPKNMLFARAMSNGAKFYAADVFGGPVYTPDELGAQVDGATGEVIDVEPVAERADIRIAAAASEPQPAADPQEEGDGPTEADKARAVALDRYQAAYERAKERGVEGAFPAAVPATATVDQIHEGAATLEKRVAK